MQQLTFPDGRPWGPPPPADPETAHALRILQDGQVHQRHALAEQLGVTVRSLRKMVATLRQAGWPVAIGPHGGYQLTWDADALDALERKYRRQALAELRTLRLIRKARERMAA